MSDSRSWSIRPKLIDGRRRYVPVAKDAATGREALGYRLMGLAAFLTASEAREWIVARYDGGRDFPAFPDPDRAYVAAPEYVKRDACYYFAPTA